MTTDDAALHQHVAALEGRVAELEVREQDHERAQLVRDALYRIAAAASTAADLPDFYAQIHAVIGDLMDARNFYIALYDAERGAINFPYYVDSVDPDIPDPSAWESFGVGDAGGLTAYVLRTGRAALVPQDRWKALVAAGEIASVGVDGEDWLGAPLLWQGAAIGVVVVQTYEAGRHYSDRDVEVLTFVADHVASALARARAIEETRQRNAELSLINEIGDALARQLDFDAIIELIGERLRGVFAARSVSIGLYDRASDAVEWRYEIDEGTRIHTDPTPAGSGLTSHVVRTGQPLRAGTLAELQRLGAIVVGGSVTVSWLGAPIRTGDDIVGIVIIESLREHAFDEADERLLATMASSMGVALDNARLFDETKRLLGEADARAAELAVINEIGGALAKQLEFDAIIELVGERVRSIFAANSIFIALYDGTTNLIRFPYDLDEGERFERGAFELGPGITSTVIRTARPLRIGSIEEQEAAGAISVGGSDTQSWLGVPIPAGDRVVGVVGLESLERNAYTDADERLLATLASSMGVALENARLFDETKRLLTETDQRAAELAIVNAVQKGLAAEIDSQAMYDLVGDKIQEIFDAQVVDIAVLDRKTRRLHFRYTIERGVRFPEESIELVGFRRHIFETDEPLLIDHDMAANDLRYDQPGVISGEPSRSWLGVPLHAGERVAGVITLQNLDNEYAFDTADVRLLTTIASSLSVALENARLVDETRQRNAELALINGIQQGLAAEIDMSAMYDLVGDKVQEIFDAQVVDIAILDAETSLLHFPYTIERGVRFPDEPLPLIGFRRKVMETREPLLVNEDVVGTALALGQESVAIQGEPARSLLFAPLVAGDQALGVISLQNLDREHAFSESDQGLLTTLAASLSVALENARLIDETRQRVAELDTVNRVGQAIQSQLDLSALIELVGEQMRETFEADIVYVALLDAEAGSSRSRTTARTAASSRSRRWRSGRDSPRRSLRSAPRCCSGGPPTGTRSASEDRDAGQDVPGRAHRGGRCGDRRDQRPEHQPGGSIRRRGCAPAVDHRCERRGRHPERPPVPGDHPARLGDGGAGRRGPGDLRDAGPGGRAAADRGAGTDAARRRFERRLPGAAGWAYLPRHGCPRRDRRPTPCRHDPDRRGDHRRRHRARRRRGRQRRPIGYPDGDHPGYRGGHRGAADGGPARRPRLRDRGDGRLAPGLGRPVLAERPGPARRTVTAGRHRHR